MDTIRSALAEATTYIDEEWCYKSITPIELAVPLADVDVDLSKSWGRYRYGIKVDGVRRMAESDAAVTGVLIDPLNPKMARVTVTPSGPPTFL